VAREHVISEDGERPAQLPSGRHGLSRGFVSRNQRERILDATAHVVAERGYNATTVGDVVAAARLSRRTFYEHFDNKTECFLAVHDQLTRELLGAVAQGWAGERDPLEKIRASLEAFIAYVVEHPDGARAAIVEVGSAGDAARGRRDRALAAFAEFFASAWRELDNQSDAPPIAVELILGGLYEIVYSRLVRGRPEELLDALPDLVYCVLVPFAGHRRAAALAVRSGATGPRTAV
jgi:AcrR family transcriptional regulator